jgi:hypothetical protein
MINGESPFGRVDLAGQTNDHGRVFSYEVKFQKNRYNSMVRRIASPMTKMDKDQSPFVHFEAQKPLKPTVFRHFYGQFLGPQGQRGLLYQLLSRLSR